MQSVLNYNPVQMFSLLLDFYHSPSMCSYDSNLGESFDYGVLTVHLSMLCSQAVFKIPGMCSQHNLIFSVNIFKSPTTTSSSIPPPPPHRLLLKLFVKLSFNSIVTIHNWGLAERGVTLNEVQHLPQPQGRGYKSDQVELVMVI